MPTNSLAVVAAFFLRTVSVRAIASSTGHAFDPVRPFTTTMVPQDEQRLEATVIEEDTHGHVDLSTVRAGWCANVDESMRWLSGYAVVAAISLCRVLTFLT
jgi:hypothetical protein